MIDRHIKHGDFTHLADNYSKNRPGYSDTILSTLLYLTGKNFNQIKFLDIGAGTGIWTTQIAKKGCKVTAIEPNDNMRKYGIKNCSEFDVEWKKGSAENTGISEELFDIVSMASSFHWTKFDFAVKEISRLLSPNGFFVCLWNTRMIEKNSLTLEIESYLNELVPDLKRVSSGKSEFCEHLTEKLSSCSYFSENMYMEGYHSEIMSQERYLGVWKSVNDVYVQAGPERFEKFLSFINQKIKDVDFIEATYKTRAWVSWKKG